MAAPLRYSSVRLVHNGTVVYFKVGRVRLVTVGAIAGGGVGAAAAAGGTIATVGEVTTGRLFGEHDERVEVRKVGRRHVGRGQETGDDHLCVYTGTDVEVVIFLRSYKNGLDWLLEKVPTPCEN
uniref:Uncharacterized protein n=1 Tax=Hyaloperonospora arabidopsidis (strain Emoy2) TaxID=559515 RepID=M4BNL0_HYAAE